MLTETVNGSWDLIGVVASETRSLATCAEMERSGTLNRAWFLEVVDPPSRWSSLATRRRGRVRRLLERRGAAVVIDQLPLFESVVTVVNWARERVRRCSGRIVLDATSMPKRICFPILRQLLRSPMVVDLTVTYTRAGRYARGPLAEDPEPWGPLPSFGGLATEAPELRVVCLGFEVLGLADMLRDSDRGAELDVLFPFPAPPPHNRRLWECLRQIGAATEREVVPRFVAPHDLWEAFDHLMEVSEKGRKRTLYAPFGPKPISIAMALMAVRDDAPIYYSQPRVYDPRYSRGVRKGAYGREVYAYLLKQGGQDLSEI